MFEIVILNARNTGQRGESVARPTPLGNPFMLKDIHDDAQRDLVCDRYRVHLDKRIQARDAVICAELDRLYELGTAQGRLELRCWCSPKRCHAEHVAQVLTGWVVGRWRR
jgi:hypothetical protein